MEIINLTLNMTGRRSSPTLTWGGTQARNLGAKTYPGNRTVKYKSSDADILTVSEDGMVTPVLDTEHEWVKKAMSYPYVNQVLAVIEATDGTSTDVCQVRVNLTVADRTYSGSSGGSGGGSGGSSGGGKPTVGGPGTVGIPSYVVNGTWHRDEAGRWSFTDGARTYADEWAAVHNPYANTAAGQNVFDWFRFDREGFMVWGWYTDMDGTVYYLNPVSDGTLGRMYTGWNWIDGKCYYFNEKSDGTRGALKKNFVTEDGYQTDQSGAWVVNGVVQTQ